MRCLRLRRQTGSRVALPSPNLISRSKGQRSGIIWHNSRAISDYESLQIQGIDVLIAVASV